MILVILAELLLAAPLTEEADNLGVFIATSIVLAWLPGLGAVAPNVTRLIAVETIA